MIDNDDFVVSDYDDEREDSSKNIKKENAKFQLDEISIEDDCVSNFQFVQRT
jgi:hypothetical protein